MEIELARLFIKVVQHGGFSRAATALGVPKSTISKAVSRLERETGTKLLLRTTRSQTLTDAGRVFYETCLQPIQTLEEAQKSLYGADSVVSGKIKITAPEDLGNYVVSSVIGELCIKYPRLEFELNYTNERVDLVKEGYDLAIRIGRAGASTLFQRKLGEVELVLVAAPKYLKAKGKILQPRDLETHQCLTIAQSSSVSEWTLKNEKRAAKIKIRSHVRVNHVTSLVKMAVLGAGVGLLPKYLCQHEIEEGRLVQILPDWYSDRVSVSLVSPTSTTSSSRLNLVSSEIAVAIKRTLDPS